MEVAWVTIEAIAQTQAIDLWLLFPLGQAVNRLLTRHGPPEGLWAQRLTQMFGTEAWKDALDIIANNPIDQKVVELCPSQHYSLVEHSMYRSVFPPQGVENGVFLPASPRASKAFADHDESDACGISAIARTFSVCLGSVCATTLC